MDRRRRFREVLLYNLANPFAQTSRFVGKPSSTIPATTEALEDFVRKISKRKAEGEPEQTRHKKVSVVNLPPATNMAEGQGSGKEGAGLHETPIDEVLEVYRGPPTYTFASLPYWVQRTCAINDLMFTEWAFRMTSPYDCSVGGAVIDINAGTGTENVTRIVADSEDADIGAESEQQAQWWAFYAGMYKYYHVVACKWHLTFENLSTDTLYLHSYYANAEDRPLTASNQDMLMYNDVESHLVGPVAYAIEATGTVETKDVNVNTNNREFSTVAELTPNFENGNMVNPPSSAPHVLKLSGEYRTGDYEREVRLDENVENWTLTNANPKLPERHHFRIKPVWDATTNGNSATTYVGRPVKYRYTYKVDYLVEFKELKPNLKYPISRQPLTVSISANRN